MKSNPMNSVPYELYLISQSPRRREILEKAGFLFRVDTVKVSEFINKNVSLRRAVSELAREKAQAYLNEHKYLKGQRILLLAADTIVHLEGRVLGKPKNVSEAAEFLKQLSGKMHSVITGFAILELDQGLECLGSEESFVKFKELSEDEILAYVKTGEPMDKAGAYGIQGEGGRFVSQLEGLWSNVVGLPVESLIKILDEKGWNVIQREPK